MVAPSMPDAEKVAAVREALPAVAAGIYLNAPVAGPIPAEAAAAMTEIAEWDLRTGRAHRERAADVAARVDEARASVAAILTADLADVSLAHGIDDALVVALRPVGLRAGDRVVVVDDPELERLGGIVPSGVVVQTVTARDATDAVIDGPLAALVVPIVSATGERLPVETLADAARAAGGQTVVDASLAVGAVPVRPAELGADALVARAERWLLGPEGLAIVAGPGARHAGPGARPGGATGAFHLPSVVGFARGCGWLSMYVGLPWVHDRGRTLTAHAADRLSAIDGVELLTPERRATTLVFRVPGWRPDEVLDELGGRIFLLASEVPSLGAVRIGIGFWNTEPELDRFADGIELLARHTPDTLPRRAALTVLGEA